MKYVQRYILIFLLMVGSRVSLAAEFKPFNSQSRAAIEQTHIGKPFILAFWSVDCTYCMDDLKALGELARLEPRISLVTVCTDGRETADRASKMLDAANLPEHVRWQFAEPDEERLRYNIDKSWYGELPRTYFYDAQHQVQAISGQPESKWLEATIKKLRKPN